MLDGWISSGRNGSSLTRPDSTSALMSRSESSTLATYSFCQGTGSLSGLYLGRRPSVGPAAVAQAIRYDVGAGRVCGRRHRSLAGDSLLAGVVQWQNVSFPS